MLKKNRKIKKITKDTFLKQKNFFEPSISLPRKKPYRDKQNPSVNTHTHRTAADWFN